VESLYFGCPLFGTPYGSLPELMGRKINPEKEADQRSAALDAYYSDYGCLSQKKSDLVEAIQNAESYDRLRCHQYAVEQFSAEKMAKGYLRLYEQVLNGKQLHDQAPQLTESPPSKLLPMRE
jgi:glycosyltransferase involved in cell wall biosynthesis